MFHKLFVLYFLTFLTPTVLGEDATLCRNGRPDIIFMMADDAGWNDFSFHGSPQIPTPNIDALAFSGMVLNNYYGSPLCTPTRGAIMTGKHPIHLRLQHFVIGGCTKGGLPLEEKLLPQYLKELDYSTYLVGKWHLGHSRKSYLPTQRGFDSHFGYWLGKQDYYSHYSLDAGKYWGYDFRSNLSLNFDVMGKYDTDLFTTEAIRLISAQPKERPMFLMINHNAPHSANGNRNLKSPALNFSFPLQAPIDSIEKFIPSIEDPHRRVYAAMVDKLDESVGMVVDALGAAGRLNNSIIVFASDNGGAPEGYDLNYGSNWPLRGAKNTVWEGGTRLAALIWSPFTQNRVSYDMFHAEDWLPTFLEAVSCGEEIIVEKIDGVSLWKTFSEGKPSPKTTILYNIDDNYNNSAVRKDQWKLVQGKTSPPDLGGFNWDHWYGPSGRSLAARTVADIIPQITSSLAAKALGAIGHEIDAENIARLQQEAEISCSYDKPKHKLECDAFQAPCLFNIEDDPCEQRNLAGKHKKVVRELLNLIKRFNETALPPIPRGADERGDPKYWGNVWTNFEDHLESGCNDDFPNLCGSNAQQQQRNETSFLLNANGLSGIFCGVLVITIFAYFR